EAGFDLQYWDENRLENRFGISRPAALFSELGGEVDPHKLTHGLLCAGSRRGLQIFYRTRVVKFSPTSRGINLLTEGGFQVKARRAVMAAGFESMNYVKGEAGQLKSTFAVISEPIESFRPWYRKSLIWESGSPYLYLRTSKDGRIIVGGEDENITQPEKRD